MPAEERKVLQGGLPIPALVGTITKMVEPEKKDKLRELLGRLKERQVDKNEFQKQLVQIVGSDVVRASIRFLKPDIDDMIVSRGVTGHKRRINSD